MQYCELFHILEMNTVLKVDHKASMAQPVVPAKGWHTQYSGTFEYRTPAQHERNKRELGLHDKTLVVDFEST